MARLVHWHEGQYLHPHHLQVMQRETLEHVATERRLTRPYPSGLIESQFSSDALANHQVRFDRLRLVMPSGLLIDVPRNADLPPLLDIKQAFEDSGGSLMVSIGVPVWAQSRGNTIDPNNGQDSRAKRIYQIAETQQPDENTGENLQSVLIRRINARLLLHGDDQTELEVMPLLKLIASGGDGLGLPRLDPAFVPPCWTLGASPTLVAMVRDVAHRVASRRKELMARLAGGGFSAETIRGVQFQQMLQFKTLSRFAALLPRFVKAPEVSPFQVYLALTELLGELSALDPTRDHLEAIDYDHGRLGLVFRDLTDGIESLLKLEGDIGFMKVAFQHDGEFPMASLTPEQLAHASEYYLAVRTDDDPRMLAKLVEDDDQFILTAVSNISKRIRGLKLEEERNPPLQFPAQVGLNYFRILTADRPEVWQLIQEETTMAACWPAMDRSDYQLELYMTVPT